MKSSASNIKSVRLSKDVIPERYEIMLHPDMEAFTYSGEETIFFELRKPTKQITLHSKQLKIEGASVVAKTTNWAGKISYKPKDETATFTFPKTIPAGSHQLKLSFRGVLTDQLKGFYHSTYTHKGETKHIAVTQLEATDARQAFPCFDEPAQKAIFDVTLMVPQHMTAISNTIETEITNHDSGIKVVKFAPTPKMSTYLLAFIVGEFEFIEGKTKDGVVVRIFTTPGKKQQGQFALDVAIRTLDFFNTYFNIPYPLPILDMIAIPDFASAAMENWGAVTYRETALLVDNNTALANRQRIAHVIAHELTHQWFGNLVTMEWWTHLWLNESFATYMSYVAIDKLFPEWNFWSQFTYDDLGSALDLDALGTTHPIEVEVHHPDQIDEIFDGISYEKGASVIRMMANYIGEKDFREGLSYYLKKHSYKNTFTIDLWKAFEKISGKPVRKMMDIWTSKSGHPIISVAKKDGHIALRQSRYFFSPLTAQQSNDKTVWPIPVKVMDFAKKGATYAFMDKKQATLPASKQGIKLNSGEVGFYRTAYSSELLSPIMAHVKDKTLLQDDRLGIIRDAFALTGTGHTSISDLFDLLQFYKHETAYNVWVEILSGLGEINVLLSGQEIQKEYKAYCLNFLLPLSKTINWAPKTGESNNVTLLRSMALSSLAHYGHKPTITQAQDLYKKAAAGKPVHPDIRAVVYNIAAEHGGSKEHAAMLALYRATDSHEEKNRLTRAIMQFRQDNLIKKGIKFVFSKEVRSQDAPIGYIAGWRNPYARHTLWEYMKNNWPDLLERYGQGGRMLGYMIKPLSSFTDPKIAAEIKKFLKTHPVPSGALSAKQTIERLDAHVYRLKRDLPLIIAYFTSIKL